MFTDAHARRINGDSKHKMTTEPLGAETAYGECHNSNCQAGFYVEVANGKSVVTDDSASGTPCPYPQYWQISAIHGGLDKNVEYPDPDRKFRTEPVARAAFKNAGPGHRLAHFDGPSFDFIAEK